MRKIYFIRHAKPLLPQEEKICLGGRSDPPLSPFGLMQSCVLGEEFSHKKLQAVYSSDLLRAKETASFLAPRYQIEPGLNEVDMGSWDGLSFVEIAKDYPELYARRGENPSLMPPGAESLEDSAKRFESAVRNILKESRGDIAIVTHGGILDAYFHMGKIGYAQYFVTDEHLKILQNPRSAWVPMTPKLCRKMHKAVNLLENIRLHCEAEAKLTRKICRALRKSGIYLDEDLVYCSALLHDIARLERNHESTGGTYLTDLGYPEVGNLIRQHFEPDHPGINEASVLFISDMNTLEHHYVPVDYRFYDSFQRHMLSRYELFRKIGIMEIFEKHRHQAEQIRDLINSACGRRVVK